MPHKTHLLFATPLVATRLEDAEMDAGLIEAVSERRRAHPGSRHSNLGGWQSDMGLLHWGGPAARKLGCAVVALADAVTADEAGAAPDWSLEGWANVNEAGHANLPHSHAGAAGCFWSAVYYLQVPPGEGGELVFQDPRGPVVGMHAPGLFFRDAGGERRANLKPEAGLLILFPAWLIHSVLPWQGREPRVSIAFNLAAAARARGQPVSAAELR